MTEALVTQVAREDLVEPDPKLRVAEMLREVVYAGDPIVRIPTVFREILHSVPTGVFRGIIGDLAELWFAPGVFIDFSIEANRRKFRKANGKAASLSNDGSGPTGTPPLFYMTITPFSTNENDFLVNYADSGSFVLGTRDGDGAGYGIAPTTPG
jgi:hypothetical protein